MIPFKSNETILGNNTGSIVAVASDPSTGAGRAAPIGSVAYLAGSETCWQKVGTANTAWVPFVGQAWYGDQSDGDVTVGGTTILTRDMYYRDLVVSVGGKISARGWRIFARTIECDGTIESNGATATGFNSVAATPVGSWGQLGGGSGAGARGAGSAPGFSSYDNIIGSVCSGGKGGAGTIGTGGNGTISNDNRQASRNFPMALTGKGPVFSQVFESFYFGCPGGGGGGDSISYGGAGGAGGGGLAILARTIKGSGTLDVSGGAGAPGQGINCGGGGGGGGGTLVLATHYANIATNIAGGAGGASGGGAGDPGIAGGDGLLMKYPL